jgi:hypothetical protein
MGLPRNSPRKGKTAKVMGGELGIGIDERLQAIQIVALRAILTDDWIAAIAAVRPPFGKEQWELQSGHSTCRCR